MNFNSRKNYYIKSEPFISFFSTVVPYLRVTIDFEKKNTHKKILEFLNPFHPFPRRRPQQGAREMESGSESDAPEELTAGEVIS
jgi:hypothetical protein